MRAPDDLPRRRRRERKPGRSRVLLIVGVVLAFILLTSLRGIAGFYTDYLWFDSLGQSGVWRGILGAKASLVLIFMATFFVLAWVNLYVAERFAPPFRLSGPEDELLERYHDLVAGRTAWVRGGVAGVLALIAGSGVSGEWNSWLLFTHGGDFGVEDPQFGRDIGFYVFRLPFLSFVVDWLFASLLIVLIVTAVAHYLSGGIRVQPPSPRVTPQVKAHLSVLLAALALVKAVDYWLQRFELTTSSRGVVDGASYTDVRAQLPALNLLVLISLAAAALFVVNIFRRGWTLPVMAVGLWGFVAIVVGGIYPQFVQWSQVRPNESVRERPYIERNIAATQAALGLDTVDVRRFTPKTVAEDIDPSASALTIRNIRLWDPVSSVSGLTFQQLQRIRDYYRIADVDVDRYVVNGEVTQVNIGTRTIDSDRVPSDSWEGRHLAYTHGYGVVLAPSNASEGSEPNFLIRDIPARAEGGLTLDRPGIYFGEDLDGYVMVNTDRNEIDYEGEDRTQFAEYDGEDGVDAGSLFRRTAFALRFGDINPIISDFITGDSRVVYIRDVVERVEALAPFLHHDQDPYPVVLDGQVLWVVDLYTTTDRYPYAQRADTDQLGPESGLDRRFNYVRNSVKATVDAYDGTVRFYVMDDEDPIIEAYRKAFPDLFTDDDNMPSGLGNHLRYPEDLFRIQTAAYGRYHLEDPDDFFTQGDGWRVARDPGTAGAAAAVPVTDASGQPTGGADDPRISPYYQLLQLPGEEEAEMVLMRPFVPFSPNDESQQLTAFMAARMDPGRYGQLMVYEMPSGELPDGPGIVASTIRADNAVSEQETLLGRGGSKVQYGNLLLLPVDDALLYVQPFYVVATGEGRELPRLEKVIAVLGDQVVIRDTLAEALGELIDARVATQERPDEPGGAQPPDQGGEPQGTVEDRAAGLLEEARALFAQADEALERGDLATYQDRIEKGRDKVDEANDLLTGQTPAEGEGTADGGSDGSGTTTTTEETTPA